MSCEICGAVTPKGWTRCPECLPPETKRFDLLGLEEDLKAELVLFKGREFNHAAVLEINAALERVLGLHGLPPKAWIQLQIETTEGGTISLIDAVPCQDGRGFIITDGGSMQQLVKMAELRWPAGGPSWLMRLWRAVLRLLGRLLD